MELDKWQEEVLDCDDKHILLAKGRQIGGTTIMAIKCAKEMVKHKNCKIVVASITEDQAHLVIMMVLTYLDKHYPNSIKKPYSRNITKSSITLWNGSSILSRPVGSTGNSVRGFTGDVLYLNEASRMPEFIFEAAKPILLTTAGRIWMDSTPFGIGTYFHKTFLNKNDRFKVFYHSSEEVIENRPISPTWTIVQREGAIQFLKEEKLEMTKLQYQQEYLGMFVGGLQRFIPDELINSSCKINPAAPYVVLGNKYQGIDVARLGGDETVLVSLEKLYKKLRQIDLEIPEGQTLTNTARLIIHKDKKLDHVKIFIDDRGMGSGVFDICFEDPQTRRKIEGLDNSRRSVETDKSWGSHKVPYQTKKLLGEDMALNLKVLMEQGRILLFDDPRVRQSLMSMQWEDQNGTLQIHGNYSHIFEALKRAAWCTKRKGSNTWVR